MDPLELYRMGIRSSYLPSGQ